MTPYYSDGTVTIYHGDCRDVLPFVSADVAITDPPYNVGVAYGTATNDRRSDYEAWCRQWFNALFSIAPVIALTPGIANIGIWYRIAQPFWVMSWHKPAAMGRAPMGFNNWEPVLIYGKPQTSPTVDVVTAPIIPNAEVAGHPCPKPIRLAKGLLKQLARPTDVIIDPFCGSGTTLRAALDLGHRAIGIEIEEQYCEMAAERLAQGVLDLFGEATA